MLVTKNFNAFNLMCMGRYVDDPKVILPLSPLPVITKKIALSANL